METTSAFMTRTMFGAAVIGILGAAGLFIIEQLYSEKRRMLLAQDLARLDRQVASMREELQALRELQNQRTLRKQRHANNHAKRPPHSKPSKKSSPEGTPGIGKAQSVTSYTSDTDFTEYNSVAGTDYDVSSEEFYDMSTDSDGGGSVASERSRKSENGHRRNGASKKDESDLVEIFTKTDALLHGGVDEDVRTAFKVLGELLEPASRPDAEVAEILWRLGQCCQRMSNVFEKNGDIDGKKESIFEGIKYCQEAVAKNPLNANTHKWYAILVGLRSDFVATKDKVLDGALFKHHVEEALRLNPDDASLYHLLGRFKFEIASLSWIEKKVASTLFGEIPQTDFDEALQDFHKAEELSHWEWKENRLLLAKCYINKKEYSEAVKWLDTTIQSKSVTSDDRVAEIEAQTLLKKYDSYRLQ